MEGSSQKSLWKKEKDFYHVTHKVPCGDGPYVEAKQAQLVQKDLEGAIVWFWKAINAGDRVESALKDMVLVMKQLHRSEEAIEAINSFRPRCSKQAHESLDNLLLDLYKKCGKVDEQIALLKKKLRLIYQGETFNGKPTKKARSHGKKVQVSIKQETSRLLGNLGWAYVQKTKNYMAGEVVYKKAQMIDPDANKACNLALCLIKQARYDEARTVLEDVLQARLPGSDTRSRNQAEELLLDLQPLQPPPFLPGLDLDDEDFVDGLERWMNEWAPLRSKRLPIFEEISPFRDQLAC